MERLINELTVSGTEIVKKLVMALLIYFIGRFVIEHLMKLFDKLGSVRWVEPTVRSFVGNLLRTLLYVLLLLSIIAVLGVPMASIVAVLASAGIAVGMSLQGSLGNLAGGLMLMIFRPFSVGDYISASGADGSVREITIFYTTLNTPDNKRVMIPNGALMNANVVNFSREATRRVDMSFVTSRGEDVSEVERLCREAVFEVEKILREPAPEIHLDKAGENFYSFTVKVWVRTEDYWEVYYDTTKRVTEALSRSGVRQPETHLVSAGT
ncbi:mechanosensitive ion channel family protein [Lachnoclostridium sp. Marseille-P6806]|uniref:mechanosensitive ion channel family protein n=1 Tax=Lachnoclostridium sp. Marseille-P6806 TaxID=2364793 RepID=UPI0013EF082D|nr:mechanosensitive ion channel domain-containing protein [Lachnoclostridium sp. Marseille-P6806]